MTDQFKQKLLGIGLVVLGLGLFFPGGLFIARVIPSAYRDHAPLVWFALAWGLPILGLHYYTRAVGHDMPLDSYRGRIRWPWFGLFPVLGPMWGLLLIALDELVYKIVGPQGVKKYSSLTGYISEFIMVVAIIGALTAAFLPAAKAREGMRHQAEARTNLTGIYILETEFYKQHRRYGTFEEIGFTPTGDGRYTYRLDRSGAAGTIIPARLGPTTPGNTVVPAEIRMNPPSFTATATANVDDDGTIDQWHINERKEGLKKADVNDVPRPPKEYWRVWFRDLLR